MRFVVDKFDERIKGAFPTVDFPINGNFIVKVAPTIDVTIDPTLTLDELLTRKMLGTLAYYSAFNYIISEDFLNAHDIEIPPSPDGTILCAAVGAVDGGAFCPASCQLFPVSVSPGLITAIISGSRLDDSTKTWATNIHAGKFVAITSGAGAGQERTITSNTSTSLTVSPVWTTLPTIGDSYEIKDTSYGRITSLPVTAPPPPLVHPVIVTWEIYTLTNLETGNVVHQYYSELESDRITCEISFDNGGHWEAVYNNTFTELSHTGTQVKVRFTNNLTLSTQKVWMNSYSILYT
jgi:hypothetical protein